MRRFVIAACVLAVSACGVSAQDEAQIIEESTQPPPTATPSFETETSPPAVDPSAPGTSSSPSSSPSSPAPSSTSSG
jgi:hypothetical protein